MSTVSDGRKRYFLANGNLIYDALYYFDPQSDSTILPNVDNFEAIDRQKFERQKGASVHDPATHSWLRESSFGDKVDSMWLERQRFYARQRQERYASWLAEKDLLSQKNSGEEHGLAGASLGDHSSDLRKMLVPQSLMDEFVRLASSNTEKNRETCGFLAGNVFGDELNVTTLILPPQVTAIDSRPVNLTLAL
jgi:hypothetical protein